MEKRVSQFVSAGEKKGSLEDFVRILLKDYGFSILSRGDYTKDKKYLKINSVDELMNFCRGGGYANLFLEKER